jgi:hypothetical protein
LYRFHLLDKKYIKVLVENRKNNNYKIKDYLYLANKKRPELELEEMYEKVCKE